VMSIVITILILIVVSLNKVLYNSKLNKLLIKLSLLEIVKLLA